MSSKFLLSAAFASITAALLAMPAHAAPFQTAPVTSLTEASSFVTTASVHRDQHKRVVRPNHLSGYVEQQDHRSGYVVRHGHRSGHAVRHGHQRRHGH